MRDEQNDGPAARYSVIYPLNPVDPVDHETWARFVEMTGMQRMYFGQTLVHEPHLIMAQLAKTGIDVALGTAVSLMAFRHPFLAALHARDLALATGRPYVAGLGLGSRQFNESVNGGWPGSPLTYVREYASIVRSLLAGERVSTEGRYFPFSGALMQVPGDPSVELGLGVLRPAMARLAGSVADVAISWLTPPHYCSDILVPALEAGAVDRVSPPRLTAVVAVGVDAVGRDPIGLAKAGLEHHLAAPHYGDALQKAGFDIVIGDAVHNVREVVDRGLYVYGSPAQVVDALEEYFAAGVQEVVLNLSGVFIAHGPFAALRDLDAIVGEIDRRGGDSARISVNASSDRV